MSREPGPRDPLATAYRDAGCGTPDEAWEGRRVALAGWVHRRRDLGGLVFVDLRDRTGLVQLSFGPDWSPPEVLRLAGDLRAEDVIRVEGPVTARPPEAVNPDLPTGGVEVRAAVLERLSAAASPPIPVARPPEEPLPAEEARLRYRYLDLRRPEMLRNFRVRHLATAAARAALSEEGFLEVETPLLTRRTPEGARDYLVPSRVHRGEFFALPQSPQLYKQVLMAAGFDRYFQIARCLRDEDLRADRQPEFTQVDVEMAFVDEEDVFGVAERTLARMWREAAGEELAIPFPRLTHAEALERYGTDRPDLRIPWELRDFTPVLAGRGFRIVDGPVEAGGRVRGFVIPGERPSADPGSSGAGVAPAASLSRAELERLNEVAREAGAGGALWLKRGADGWSGPAARAVDEEAGERLTREFGLAGGDIVLLVAGEERVTGRALDALRRAAAAALGAVAPESRPLWIVEFPLFEPDPETGLPVPSSHPFTMPLERDPDRLREEPFAVRARAYDVVYNGSEILSGSIRCHDPALQSAILGALGLSEAETEERFGFLLEAFRHGVPPHGGFAAGLDRIVALLLGAASIREVIAFPKTAQARGLMEGAPSPIPDEELRELGIRIAVPERGAGSAKGLPERGASAKGSSPDREGTGAADGQTPEGEAGV